jgi:CelD/BcsL family acetyltransferase involved in cellulose biosynthesis
MLGGVPPEVLRAADGRSYRVREETAPLVDLAALRAGGLDWIATLSANTRYQLRRSARFFESLGPLRLARAATLPEALLWLDALSGLHSESWRLRGQPGAFAADFSRRFHRSLVERAQPRGELDLLRLEAGGAAIAYLYNFRLGGRVYAYQSGLDHAQAGSHGKPGLTAHAMAIERALAEGQAAYDFLAGAARYKLSLANAAVPLCWAELVPRWSARGLVAQLRSLSQRTARKPG